MKVIYLRQKAGSDKLIEDLERALMLAKKGFYSGGMMILICNKDKEVEWTVASMPITQAIGSMEVVKHSLISGD